MWSGVYWSWVKGKGLLVWGLRFWIDHHALWQYIGLGTGAEGVSLFFMNLLPREKGSITNYAPIVLDRDRFRGA